ncbi:unnamed protein product [Vicia faba]|uniref:Uncharacterized protein n=1 Tax=Vicia faba TaxID=3906 RepID=A0AAV1BD69_VICFA|nr:unnamed protein product [Vicia faba]
MPIVEEVNYNPNFGESRDDNSQLSTFVDATQVANGVEFPVTDVIFLNNSWANLEELSEEPIPNEGVFTSVISNLKKKRCKLWLDLNNIQYLHPLPWTFFGYFTTIDMSMVDDTIPLLVDDNMNVILMKFPSLDKISSVVFALNKDSVSGLDSFRAVFLSNLLGYHQGGHLECCFGFFSHRRSLISAVVLIGRTRLLSRRILQLFSSNHLNLITSPNNIIVPSHILYTNDVSIFYKEFSYSFLVSRGSRFSKVGWISLLCDIEREMRRFIWSGETSKNKLVTVVWNNICKSIVEGGLGIRSLFNLNEASNLKLSWELFHSSGSWGYSHLGTSLA